jgi:DinB superfamily
VSDLITHEIAERIAKTHARLLEIVADLSEDQVGWRPDAHAPPIGFHLWHMARWADRVQATLPAMSAVLGQRLGPGGEIWAAQALAHQWGWATEALGYGQTGMELADELAAALQLPPTPILVAYARQAFAAADRAFGAIDDQLLQERGPDIYGRVSSVGYVLLAHLAHASRHLGMIEGLRGVQGLRGTATV